MQNNIKKLLFGKLKFYGIISLIISFLSVILISCGNRDFNSTADSEDVSDSTTESFYDSYATNSNIDDEDTDSIENTENTGSEDTSEETGSEDTSEETGSLDEKNVETPSGVSFNTYSHILSWNNVDGADSYKVSYNGTILGIDTTELKINLTALSNSFKVMAVADSIESEWSEEIKFDFEETVSLEGIKYCILNNKAMVTGYVGTEKNVVIPPLIAGYDVTSIADEAFYSNKSDIGRLVIPESIIYIGKNAFDACIGLEIMLPTEADILEWEKNAVIEEGNKDVLDVIKGERPAIGWSKWV